jgi:hypothetical protein
MKGYAPEAIDHNNTLMTHILSSSFNRTDYSIAYRQLFNLSRGKHGSWGEFDTMNGTPLNSILTGMHILLSDFKKKHQIQKTTFVLLTDGDSQKITPQDNYIYDNRENRSNNYHIFLSESKRSLRVNKKYAVKTTANLLEAIRKEIPGLSVIGYFVASCNRSFDIAVGRATGRYEYSIVHNARKIANKQKFVSYDNALGYNRYFILKSTLRSDLEAKNDEFTVSDKAKRGELARAFKKYTKSKKGNRILATQFAEIIS